MSADAARLNYPRPGFTLVEMVLSMTICMIVLGAAYSVMLLASKTVPSATNPQTCTLEGARALDQLLGDLTYATAVTDLKAREISFIVHDRTGDNVADTLKYEWSGTAGTALTYSVNGGIARTIAEDVREFQLTGHTGTTTPPPVYTWSNEVALFSYDSLLNLGSGAITSTNWFGEVFSPAFGTDVRRWMVTRVRLPVKTNGATDGQALVQLRTVSGGLPTGTVLDQATLTESTLAGGFSRPGLMFDGGTPIDPGSQIAIVVRWSAGATACELQYQNLLYLGNNASLVTTVNGGTSWTGISGQSMVFEVYGKVETVQYGTPTNYLDQIKCVMRVGTKATSRVEANVPLLNRPVFP